MFTPAAAQLKKHLPDAQIDALVMFHGVEDIYKRTGFFNNVLFFDYLNESKIASLQFTAGLRKTYDYSISVYPANRPEYNGINFTIGAPKRGAVTYIRNNTLHLGFLNNITVQEQDTMHNVQENIALVQKMFGFTDSEQTPLSFPLTDEDKQFAGSYLAEKQIKTGDRIVGFHAGCSMLKNHINRRWEPHKFAGLGKRIAALPDTHVLVFGGPEEDGLKNEIIRGIQAPNAHSVVTKNLAQSAALIGRCSFFVTNDSSLLHVASAMQRKVLAIIGPTNTHYIHPWATEYKIASLNLECAPCFFYSPKPLLCSRTDTQFKCIKELTVDHVWQQLQQWV